MNATKRTGNRWTINELLSLQREYELLELSIVEIALRHQRTPNAIMFKLDNEGFADYNDLFGQLYSLRQTDIVKEDNEDVDEEEDNEEEDNDSEYFGEDMSDDVVSQVDNLNERVWNLETSVNEISSMVKKMFDNMITNNTKGLTTSR